MSLTSLKHYFVPNQANELVQLLDEYEGSSLILAGGSFVHGLSARDLLWGMEALIDINRLGLTGIEEEADGFRIGATTRLIDIAKTSSFSARPVFAAITDALIYPPKQILNVATIGGNIATACPFFDLPTVLLAFQADIQIDGAQGRRSLALDKFMLSPFENALEANEFLSAVIVQSVDLNAASAFLKLETNANDLALVNVSAYLSLDTQGRICDVRIALGGGVAGTPVRALAAEQVAMGSTPSEELFEAAAEEVVKDIDPIADHRCSAAYRSHMAKVLTARALRKAYGRLPSGA